MISVSMEGFILNREKQPKSLNFPLHYHPSYELFIVIKGMTTILVDNKLISVNEKEIVLLKPDVVHKNVGENLHDRYSIHFTNEYLLSHFSDNLAKSLAEPFDNNKIAVTDSAFAIILDLIKRIEKNPEYACIHSAEIIAILTDKGNIKTADTNTPLKTTDNILEYIRENYSNITGLDDIANNVHISKQYLCQVFKKETGVTVSDYLNSIRINNACEILRRGRHNITKTAILCGYNSTPYFCRVFKNIMHMTPKEYVRNILGGQ